MYIFRSINTDIYIYVYIAKSTIRPESSIIASNVLINFQMLKSFGRFCCLHLLNFILS